MVSGPRIGNSASASSGLEKQVQDLQSRQTDQTSKQCFPIQPGGPPEPIRSNTI